MKKVLLCAVAASLSLSSCTITLPVAISSNPVGTKVGTSEAGVFLRVLSFGGDASIKAAAKNGGITRVSTVDIKSFDVLGIYQKYTTIITGE